MLQCGGKALSENWESFFHIFLNSTSILQRLALQTIPTPCRFPFDLCHLLMSCRPKWINLIEVVGGVLPSQELRVYHSTSVHFNSRASPDTVAGIKTYILLNIMQTHAVSCTVIRAHKSVLQTLWRLLDLLLTKFKDWFCFKRFLFQKIITLLQPHSPFPWIAHGRNIEKFYITLENLLFLPLFIQRHIGSYSYTSLLKLIQWWEVTTY